MQKIKEKLFKKYPILIFMSLTSCQSYIPKDCFYLTQKDTNDCFSHQNNKICPENDVKINKLIVHQDYSLPSLLTPFYQLSISDNIITLKNKETKHKKSNFVYLYKAFNQNTGESCIAFSLDTKVWMTNYHCLKNDCNNFYDHSGNNICNKILSSNKENDLVYFSNNDINYIKTNVPKNLVQLFLDKNNKIQEKNCEKMNNIEPVIGDKTGLQYSFSLDNCNKDHLGGESGSPIFKDQYLQGITWGKKDSLIFFNPIIDN